MNLLADGDPFPFDNVASEGLEPTGPSDAAELTGTLGSAHNTEADIQDAIASIDAAAHIEAVTGGDPRRMDWLTALAGLEAKRLKGEPLSDFEVQYKQNLMAVLTEGGKHEVVNVQELLYKKVGPEKYKRISRRFVDHQKELEALEKINAQLNLEIEARNKLRGPPVKGPMVINQKVDPGIWLIQVNNLGAIANSFKITPKADGTMPDVAALIRGTDNAALKKPSAAELVAELANKTAPEPTGFFAAIGRFFLRLAS